MAGGRSSTTNSGPTMNGEEFMRIGMRLFNEDAVQCKRRAARTFGRRWNTIRCYASGRRPIPQSIAIELRMWDRLRDRVETELAAQTPEEKLSDLYEIMEQIEAQKKQPMPAELMASATHCMTAEHRPTPARAVEIAELRASGCSNGEIAERLGIRKKYVENYVWKYGITCDGHIRHADGNPHQPARKIKKSLAS